MKDSKANCIILIYDEVSGSNITNFDAIQIGVVIGQGRSQDFAPGGSVTGFGAHQTWEGPPHKFTI